jgi:hypothetical protein
MAKGCVIVGLIEDSWIRMYQLYHSEQGKFITWGDGSVDMWTSLCSEMCKDAIWIANWVFPL